MSATGTWNVVTDSPMGKQTMELKLTQEDSTLTGTASTPDETVDITEGSVDGSNLTWKINVSKPMKMGLVFKVDLDSEDAFAGTVKAGMFPAMKVTGSKS